MSDVGCAYRVMGNLFDLLGEGAFKALGLAVVIFIVKAL